MSPLVAFAGLVTIGLLAMRLPRPPQHYVASLDPVLAGGAALVLSGLVLGPGIDLLTRPVLVAFAPVTTLAVGWIGAALGARFERRYLRRIPRAAWLLAMIAAAGAFIVVAVAAWLLTRAVPALAGAWTPRLAAILTLAAVGAVASPDAVARVARTTGVPRRTARALSLAATLEAAFATVAISVPLALHRSHPLAGRGPLGWLSWILLAAAGGALAGAVFIALTRGLPTRAGLGCLLVGTLAFAAGFGYAVGLSPFVVCALAAAVVVNRSPHRHAVRQLLAEWQPLVYGILLVVTGALLVLPTPWLLVAAALLVVLRAASQWASVRYSRVALHRTDVPPDFGLGTVAPGGVAIALGLSFVFTYGLQGPAAGDPTLTTIVLGVAAALLAATPLMTRALSGRVARPAAVAPAAPLTGSTAAAELSANAPAEWPR
ncbi:MAG TPA: hypothetical protein VM716_01665 [Gemmatimonadales bacterium]|nr:hypothetical protein [Gemmatimonadales bacterium]